MSFLGRHMLRALCLLTCQMFLTTAAQAQQPKAFTIPNTTIHTLHSASLGRSYDLFIKTPVGYEDQKNADLTYPVIYLNDGPYTFQVASGVTHLPMGAPHKVERAILVGISFAHDEGGMHSRVRDLTPVIDPSWTRYETGGASDYFAFIANEVIPYIETEYRADPGKRTLSGQSLGGSFGAWAMLAHQDIFDSYILTSPSLWFKDRHIFEVEAQYAQRNKDLNAKVYFAIGERETTPDGSRYPMVEQLLEFTEVLQARDYPSLELMVEVIPGAIHETTFPQGFTRGIHWLYGRE